MSKLENQPIKPVSNPPAVDMTAADKKPLKKTVKKKAEPAPEPVKKKLVTSEAAYGMLEIRYEGGGRTPDELQGLWNNKRAAQAAIDGYVARQG